LGKFLKFFRRSVLEAKIEIDGVGVAVLASEGPGNGFSEQGDKKMTVPLFPLGGTFFSIDLS
jgi:hypothetical protein